MEAEAVEWYEEEHFGHEDIVSALSVWMRPWFERILRIKNERIRIRWIYPLNKNKKWLV